MRWFAGVLRGSCIVAETRQHRRQQLGRRRSGKAERLGRLGTDCVLTSIKQIKQSVMVAWVDALGALHPLGWRRTVLASASRQTIATCPRTEAAFLQRRSLRLQGACLGLSLPHTHTRSHPTRRPRAQVPGGSGGSDIIAHLPLTTD